MPRLWPPRAAAAAPLRQPGAAEQVRHAVVAGVERREPGGDGRVEAEGAVLFGAVFFSLVIETALRGITSIACVRFSQ